MRNGGWKDDDATDWQKKGRMGMDWERKGRTELTDVINQYNVYLGIHRSR